MSPLELRCRLLLAAYPAGYREDHGEEIIGTLLEATPEGRAWPLLRDVLAIASGGLRARLALNRQRTTAANVRIAVVVGVAAYLCLDTSLWLRSAYLPWVPQHGTTSYSQFAGPVWLGPAVIAAAVILVCMCRWRPVILCAVVPAVVLVLLARGGIHYVLGTPVVVLPSLAVLGTFAGGPRRPGAGWLLPLAVVAAGPWLPGPQGPEVLVPAFAVFCIGSIIVDAKPAIAGVTFFLAAWLSWALARPDLLAFRSPVTPVTLAIAVVVATPAVWRLRRQSRVRRPRAL